MNQTDNLQTTVSSECPSQRNGGKPGRSGPPGNKNAVKHGVHSLAAMRRRGKIDKRTSFGQSFEKRKREYIADLGGDVSVMLSVIIEDTVWSDFYIATYDQYLSGLKSTVRKGRPHPIVDARARLAAHRRENIKLMGLKRVVKTRTLHELLGDDEPDTAKPLNGATQPEVAQ